MSSVLDGISAVNGIFTGRGGSRARVAGCIMRPGVYSSSPLGRVAKPPRRSTNDDAEADSEHFDGKTTDE